MYNFKEEILIERLTIEEEEKVLAGFDLTAAPEIYDTLKPEKIC